MLINETAARRIFAGGDALGRKLHFWGPSDWEVIGIVKDVRHLSPEMDAGLEVYFPIAQMTDFGLAHTVAERRTEISVRMALGASSNGIARDILGRTLRLTCAGVAIGAVFALAMTRLLGSLLYGVKPADPITFGTMIVVLLVVAAIAGALPAARAVRVSVLEAIRSE